MKIFSEQQIDQIIQLKFGKLVTEAGHPSYASNELLGKLFKVSGSQIRRLYLARFEKIRRSSLPLLMQMSEIKKMQTRERHGLRFLKKHEIKWIVSSEVLKRQASLSLMGRVEHFR